MQNSATSCSNNNDKNLYSLCYTSYYFGISKIIYFQKKHLKMLTLSYHYNWIFCKLGSHYNIYFFFLIRIFSLVHTPFFIIWNSNFFHNHSSFKFSNNFLILPFKKKKTFHFWYIPPIPRFSRVIRIMLHYWIFTNCWKNINI